MSTITRTKIKGVQAQALYLKFIIMLKHWWINRNVPSSKEQIHELGEFLMNEVDEWPPIGGGAVDLAIGVMKEQKRLLSAMGENWNELNIVIDDRNQSIAQLIGEKANISLINDDQVLRIVDLEGEYKAQQATIKGLLDDIADRDQTISSLQNQISELVEEATEHEEDKINAAINQT